MFVSDPDRPGPYSHTVLIPARGGSKGIRYKNLRNINGKPLLGHAIELAERIPANVVVSTDDDLIAGTAERYDAEVIRRDSALADDDVSIDQLVKFWADAYPEHFPLTVIQPTVFGIDSGDIRYMHAEAGGETRNWFTLAKPFHGLLYSDNFPVFPRGQRQEQKILQEIGVRYYPTPESANRAPLPISVVNRRVIDIDTYDDLYLARHKVGQVAIEFVASPDLGLGHLYRSLALADELGNHDVALVWKQTPGWEDVDETVWGLITEHRVNLVERWPPLGTQVVVMDVLNTTVDDISEHLINGCKVLTLEDEGPGRHHAHRTINALYEHGPRWAVLRHEFIGSPPKPIWGDSADIMVTFGGTDPRNLTERIERLLRENFLMSNVHVIPPPSKGGKPVGDMAGAMHRADIIICSAGRTLIEAAAMGTPAIAIPQNQRETRHTMLGVGNIPMALTATDDQIIAAIDELVHSVRLQEELSTEGRKAVDGLGAQRIAAVIEGMLP